MNDYHINVRSRPGHAPWYTWSMDVRAADEERAREIALWRIKAEFPDRPAWMWILTIKLKESGVCRASH